MIFKIRNTKTGEMLELEEFELEDKFGCDSFYNRWQPIDDEPVDACNALLYYKELIEYGTWTSPHGIRPEYELISIEFKS